MDSQKSEVGIQEAEISSKSQGKKGKRQEAGSKDGKPKNQKMNATTYAALKSLSRQKTERLIIYSKNNSITEIGVKEWERIITKL